MKNRIKIYALYIPKMNVDHHCYDDDVIFYIGRTNDIIRRMNEHRSNSKDLSDNTVKYRIIRALDNVDVPWDIKVLCDDAEDCQESEYEYVLRYSRHNMYNNIFFTTDMLPLCNMKRGDLLDEMIGIKSIQTKEDIIAYKKNKEYNKLSELALRVKDNLEKNDITVSKQERNNFNYYEYMKDLTEDLIQEMCKRLRLNEKQLNNILRAENIVPTRRLTVFEYLVGRCLVEQINVDDLITDMKSVVNHYYPEENNTGS